MDSGENSDLTVKSEGQVACPSPASTGAAEVKCNISVDKDLIKPIPYKGGFGFWNLIQYYRNNNSYLAELQKKFDSSVFKLKLHEEFIIIQDLKGIDVTYDYTKVEKIPQFGAASVNWNVTKNHRPSMTSNGRNHHLNKYALIQYNSFCQKNMNIDSFITLVQKEFESMIKIENTPGGAPIEEPLEEVLTNIYAFTMLGQVIDRKLLKSWLDESLLFVGKPNFFSKDKEITDEIFESFKKAPYVQKVREFVNSTLEDESLLAQLIWMFTFNGWAPIISFVTSTLCCFLRLAEDDKILIANEAEEFLCSTEKSFDQLTNLHYINQFYLETHRLFHLPQKNFVVAIKDFILDSSSGYFKVRKGELIMANRHLAQRDAKIFEDPEKFSLNRDLALYEKYLKTFGGMFSEAAENDNHKCTGYKITEYVFKTVLIFYTKCDIELAEPLTYTGNNLFRNIASDKPIKVKKFIYKP